ncbi:hypothetical protein NHX12_024701 [Muraenolepis orangiensis]|uniref:Uncharacterized protein n=1 Tax=Muraenolepis orangiensis TaxID=630683 RepID=A0A9Q0EHW9_9TELE|nr:hypothetical protein NHX12_024701 [Muraenolepis orangiensis]
MTSSSSSDKASQRRAPGKESPMKDLLTQTKREKASRLSLAPVSESPPLKSESESFSSPESMSRPTSSKKKTQRPSPPSTASSTLRETAGSEPVTTGPLKQAHPEPRPIWSDQQLPEAVVPATDGPTSTTRREAGKKQPAPEAKLQGASKSKAMSSQSLSSTEMSHLSGSRIPFGGDLRTDLGTPTTLVEDGVIQNVNGAPAWATVQNVKDTLRRSKGVAPPGKLSSLDRFPTSGRPAGTPVGGPLSVSREPAVRSANSIEWSVPSTPLSNQLSDTSSQVGELSPIKRVSTFHPEKEGFLQAGTISPSPCGITPQDPALQSSLTSTASLLGSVEGLIKRHGYDTALLLPASSVTRPTEGTSASASSSSSLRHPHPYFLVNLSDQMIVKDPEVHIRNLKLTNAIAGNLAGRGLGQVRLGELPLWLAVHAPSRPREAVEALKRGQHTIPS